MSMITSSGTAGNNPCVFLERCYCLCSYIHSFTVLRALSFFVYIACRKSFALILLLKLCQYFTIFIGSSSM